MTPVSLLSSSWLFSIIPCYPFCLLMFDIVQIPIFSSSLPAQGLSATYFPFAATFRMGSPPLTFFSRSPLSRCKNDLARLSDRRARAYLHTANYSLSHFLLMSLASRLTAACVSFPVHPSVLKTRGMKLLWALQGFFKFSHFWRF